MTTLWSILCLHAVSTQKHQPSDQFVEAAVASGNFAQRRVTPSFREQSDAAKVTKTSEIRKGSSLPAVRERTIHIVCSTEDFKRSAVSDTLASMSWLAGQNHAGEQSDVANSAAVERDVTGKRIDLKNKAAGIKQDKSVIKTRAAVLGVNWRFCFVDLHLTDITELLDGELDALQSFCTVKISKMRQQLISKQANGGKSRKLQHGFTAKKPEREDLNCIVPDRLMNRIRLKNSRETAKQVTEAQIHEPSVCPDCQKQKAELAEVAFLRQKKSLMESALIQEKLEEQIYSRDVLTLIGEALRSFPKPSEDPRNLWQRLKGQEMQGLKVWRGIDQRGGGDPAQLINEMIGFAPEKRESARTT
nr:PREDICTED: uncharacterized protein C8orf48 homolog [Opisthocomus hoazin]